MKDNFKMNWLVTSNKVKFFIKIGQKIKKVSHQFKHNQSAFFV